MAVARCGCAAGLCVCVEVVALSLAAGVVAGCELQPASESHARRVGTEMPLQTCRVVIVMSFGERLDRVGRVLVRPVIAKLTWVMHR